MSFCTARSKRLLCMGALLLLFVGVLLMPTKAMAITTNQYYSFGFSGTGASQGTYGVRKDTQSECFLWIQNIHMSNGVNFYIDGSVGGSGPWTNRTRNGVARGWSTGYYLIHNYVYENGERNARLTATSPSGSGSVSGYWSPDTNETWHPSLN